MSSSMRLSALTSMSLLFGAGALAAQTDHAHLGAHVLYNTTLEDAGVGAQLSIPVAWHLEFYPSFDYYFENPGTADAFNADIKYRASGAGYDWIYLGTGLNVTHEAIGAASSTETGWNLFFGAESLRGTIHPFGEARLTVRQRSAFQLQGGLNITLGRR